MKRSLEDDIENMRTGAERDLVLAFQARHRGDPAAVVHEVLGAVTDNRLRPPFRWVNELSSEETALLRAEAMNPNAAAAAFQHAIGPEQDRRDVLSRYADNDDMRRLIESNLVPAARVPRQRLQALATYFMRQPTQPRQMPTKRRKLGGRRRSRRARRRASYRL